MRRRVVFWLRTSVAVFFGVHSQGQRGGNSWPCFPACSSSSFIWLKNIEKNRTEKDSTSNDTSSFSGLVWTEPDAKKAPTAHFAAGALCTSRCRCPGASRRACRGRLFGSHEKLRCYSPGVPEPWEAPGNTERTPAQVRRYSSQSFCPWPVITQTGL